MRSRGYRVCLVKKYVIVYKVESNAVNLLGFLHQKQLYDLRFLDREAYRERVVEDEQLERLGFPMPRVSRFSFMTDNEIKMERHVAKGRIDVEDIWEWDEE